METEMQIVDAKVTPDNKIIRQNVDTERLNDKLCWFHRNHVSYKIPHTKYRSRFYMVSALLE